MKDQESPSISETIHFEKGHNETWLWARILATFQYTLPKSLTLLFAKNKRENWKKEEGIRNF